MPFYFENVYIPATFWRHLETYTPLYVHHGEAGGLGGAWRTVWNIVGRGIVVSMGGTQDMRITVDGVGPVLYDEIPLEMSLLIGFDATCHLETWRSNAAGVMCQGFALVE